VGRVGGGGVRAGAGAADGDAARLLEGVGLVRVADVCDGGAAAIAHCERGLLQPGAEPEVLIEPAHGLAEVLEQAPDVGTERGRLRLLEAALPLERDRQPRRTPGARVQQRVCPLEHLAQRVGERYAGVAALDEPAGEGVLAGACLADEADQRVLEIGHSPTCANSTTVLSAASPPVLSAASSHVAATGRTSPCRGDS